LSSTANGLPSGFVKVLTFCGSFLSAEFISCLTRLMRS
jgi:hypothetical protein